MEKNEEIFCALKGQIADLQEKFTEDEFKILDLRFGIKSGESLSLDEVCNTLKITVDAIRKVERKALKLLKES
ncbi:MAG: hypothetical protein KBT11_11220 [Treponema sp.]|nr:hypothetical protein [Candidatus Treponema equifaecale]